MKLFILLTTLLSVNASAVTYTCTTEGFPDKNGGQSIDITLKSGIVTMIKKNPGSWYSSDVSEKFPKIVANNGRTIVYSFDFGDDSSSGRLVVPIAKSIERVTFAFTDTEAGRCTYELMCDKK